MMPRGAIAQLEERLDRTQEVGGSSPPSSINDVLSRLALPQRLRRPGRRTRGPVLFAFTGVGGGPPGIGADLFAAEPAFREAVERAAAVVQDVTGYDVLRCFSDRMPTPSWANAFLVIGLLQLGQVELWRAVGVEPDATLGLSLGEIGAVYAAGGLSLEDAARLLAEWWQVRREDGTPHALFMIEAERSAATALCDTAPVPMAIGGTFSPEVACVICAADHVAPATRHIQARHRIISRSEIGFPSHTALGPAAGVALSRRVAGLTARPMSRRCFLSSLGGEFPRGAVCDARHWRRVPDTSFLYAEAADAALAMRPGTIIHIGARAYTAQYLADAARRHAVAPRMVETMVPGKPELATWRRARRRHRAWV
jgi:phthiocerol/phenolphthiocerol synthesis type-I polyketide synthase D